MPYAIKLNTNNKDTQTMDDYKTEKNYTKGARQTHKR